MKVLVVDDSRAMRMFLGFIVKEMGFAIVEAGDGSEALKSLAGASLFAAALVDIDMPNMNGMEFLAEVRKQPEYEAMKIMMVSSHTSMDAVEHALSIGAQDYLMKPLTKEMLQDKFRLLGLY